RRLTVALTCSVSLVLVSAVAVSASPGRSSLLNGVGTMVAHTLSGPAVNAEAAGGASQVLPSISIKVNPEVKLVNSVLLTDQVTIACGAFISQQFGAASLEIVEAVGNSVAHSYA